MDGYVIVLFGMYIIEMDGWKSFYSYGFIRTLNIWEHSHPDQIGKSSS